MISNEQMELIKQASDKFNESTNVLSDADYTELIKQAVHSAPSEFLKQRAALFMKELSDRGEVTSIPNWAAYAIVGFAAVGVAVTLKKGYDYGKGFFAKDEDEEKDTPKKEKKAA